MTEKDKIVELLFNPYEVNQLLGVQLAMSVLNWSEYDIASHVVDYYLNINKDYINNLFFGFKIYYSVSTDKIWVHVMQLETIWKSMEYSDKARLNDIRLLKYIVEQKLKTKLQSNGN
jgi:hypothetical protein